MKKEEVKLLMKQNQVKQWEVAEAMGISEFTLCRWLRKDLKGKQLERLNSAIKKVRSGKEETNGKEGHYWNDLRQKRLQSCLTWML